jgi:hypothetical protein
VLQIETDSSCVKIGLFVHDQIQLFAVKILVLPSFHFLSSSAHFDVTDHIHFRYLNLSNQNVD